MRALAGGTIDDGPWRCRAYTDRALALDPKNPDADTASSLVMLLEGRYDEAAVHARKAARLAPG